MLSALRRHMTMTRVWLAVIMSICLSVLAWDSVRSYVENRRQTVDRLAALGKVVEARAMTTFRSLDMLLREAVDKVPELDGKGRNEYLRYLRSRSYIYTEPLNVSIVSPDGVVLHSSEASFVGRIVGARSYLDHFNAHPDDDSLFISEPTVSIGGNQLVFAARAARRADGSLRAVAVTGVRQSLLQSLLAPALPSDEAGAVAVLRGDGLILSRYPETTPSSVGADLSQSPLFRAHVGSKQSLTVQEGGGGPDGIDRLVVVRDAEQFGLIVAVTVDRSVLWRPVLQTIGADSVFLILVGAVSLILARFLGAVERRRRDAQDQIAAARDYYMRLLDRLPLHIWRTDDAGKLDYVNAAMQDFLGDQPGDDLTRFVHPADRHAASQAAIHRLSTQGGGELEYRLRRADGEYRWVHEAVQPFLNENGRFAGHLGACLDVTDTREFQEKLTQSNAELEQFAYVTSHDLREPLRMINSYLGLIERRLPADAGEDLNEFLAFARDGAARMDKLILDLLQYSRIGRMSAPKTETSLGRAVEYALMNLHAALEEADAEICIGELPEVSASSDDMVRLFQNLLSNALKYRKADIKPRISIEAIREMGMWRIAVSDNGIGLESGDFDRIFRIFQRLHAREEHGGGSGIGLSICKKIVENHQGRIWVESAGAGQGSTFVFTLPAMDAV